MCRGRDVGESGDEWVGVSVCSCMSCQKCVLVVTLALN